MNKVLYINKPKGITSFDVCYKLRKVFNTKRIGHTGTLDPNATGVMVVLIDEATKGVQFLVSDKKEYIARVKLGIETDSLDICGNIINSQDYLLPNKDNIVAVLNSFLGESKQLVPLTSAKRVNGKKLYNYQRDNQEVEIPTININVYDIELLNIYEDGFDFRVLVSSGTYIRSLVRDICEKLNVIGTTLELKRTKIDDISLSDCDELENVINGSYCEHNLFDVLKTRYKTYSVDTDVDVKNGKRLSINSDEKYLLITFNDTLLAMYTKDGDEYKSARGLW